MRSAQKEKCERPEPPFQSKEGGQDENNGHRARYLSILALQGVHVGSLAPDEEKVVSVLKAHPDSEKLSVDRREALAQEVLDTLEQLEGLEKEIAVKLFRAIIGAEEHIPEHYVNAVTQITIGSMEERKAVEHEVQRPFMIAEFSREIRQMENYEQAAPELEKGLDGLDDDIKGLARTVLRSILGVSSHEETMESLMMLEWIPSRIINEYGPVGAILEFCELWQRLRDDGSDDKMAIAGMCAFGSMLDDEIKPTETATRIIDGLDLDFEDIHQAIADSVRILQS